MRDQRPPPAESQRAKRSFPAGSGFDFYVLSLSWSPSYCEAEGDNANRQQCDIGRPYAFVVHGLWPQFERGFPADCDTAEREVDNDTLRSLYDIMPSSGLIRHEWRKHGTCSGLSQHDYFHVAAAWRASASSCPNNSAGCGTTDAAAQQRRAGVPSIQSRPEG